MCKDNDQNSNDNDKDTEQQQQRGHVSSRGASNLAPPLPYLQDFFTALSNPCDATTNPSGYVPVCVAENKLVTDLLQERLTQPKLAEAGFGSAEVYSYNNMLGLEVLRETLAQFYQQHFSCSATTNITIHKNHLAVGAGVMSFLNSLFYALGNDKDAVLIPAPYYAAFDNDIRAYAGCVPVPVHCEKPSVGPTMEELEQAKQYAENQLGLKVRFLLLTNPHNPLGVVYAPEQLLSWIDWANNHNMETVVDEIYALSVFDDTADFTSVIQLLHNQLLSNNVHVLWGLSKDFGASGFRIGVLYTQNEVLLAALSNLNAFAAVSHPMQRMMAHLLSDTTFVQQFLQTSKQRLQQSYHICTNVLQQCQIPYTQAQAGMFVYIDLSSLLLSNNASSAATSSWEDEQTLSKRFVQEAKMIMTPGHYNS